MSTIGNRIREKRLELGLSVDELADKLGKNRATVYRYESDYIENFPISVITPLADALQTSPSYLMGWTNTAPSWEDEFRTRMAEHVKYADAADLEAAGFNREEMFAIMDRKKSLSIESACTLADQFGLSIDALVGREGFDNKKEMPATKVDDEPTDKWDELIQLLRQIPENQQDMLYNMIEAALRSHGLLK